MKKYICAALIAVSSAVSAAEDWQLLSDGGNARLLVDTSSFRVDNSNADGPAIAAKFRYFNDGQMLTPFVFATFAETCVSKAGIIYSRNFKDGAWVTTNTYFWSADGSRMYDEAGKFLCLLLEKLVQKSSSKDASKSKITL